MFGWLWRKTKTLWHLAKSERAEPKEIGWAVAIGVFVGCSPAFGFHYALALGAATLFKKNRLFTFLGSRVSNTLVIPFIVLAEVQISHRLRTGDWVAIDRHNAVELAPTLLLDWCLGAIPFGCAMAVVIGVAAWRIALWRDQRRALALQKAEQPGTL